MNQRFSCAYKELAKQGKPSRNVEINFEHSGGGGGPGQAGPYKRSIFLSALGAASGRLAPVLVFPPSSPWWSALGSDLRFTFFLLPLRFIRVKALPTVRLISLRELTRRGLPYGWLPRKVSNLIQSWRPNALTMDSGVLVPWGRHPFQNTSAVGCKDGRGAPCGQPNSGPPWGVPVET